VHDLISRVPSLGRVGRVVWKFETTKVVAPVHVG
jgi:hypothetical protein